MGNYDYIQSPVSGQPVSKSQFGDRVIEAINDLDQRLSGFDGSSGTGVASATTTLTTGAVANVEVAALTITSFTFRAGFAYRAHLRGGINTGAATLALSIRLRKTNAAGADYGEFYRFAAYPNGVAPASGVIFLLRTASTDLTTDVCLTVAPCTANATGFYANATSPRYLVIEPAGFASQFAGLGISVT